jgi:Protein of unknown function (DUF3455)
VASPPRAVLVLVPNLRPRLELGHRARLQDVVASAVTRGLYLDSNRSAFMSSITGSRLWKTWFEYLARLAVVGAVAGLVPSIAYAQGADAPNVPAALQVPDGQVLLFRAFAVGTQNYECQSNDSGATTWTFLQPKAVLVGDEGESLGIHGRGPFWAAYDGSRVVGSAPVSAPGRDPAHDVPLLLLRATPAEADGQFAGVSYIQRLDTRGGAAPAGPCNPEQQPTLEVPYLAVYYFYGPASGATQES